jgi:hypothetical protein
VATYGAGMEWRTPRRPARLPAGFIEPCNPTVLGQGGLAVQSVQAPLLQKHARDTKRAPFALLSANVLPRSAHLPSTFVSRRDCCRAAMAGCASVLVILVF